MNKPLEDSIKVWEGHLAETDPRKIVLGSNNCPLCRVYLDLGHLNKCLQCPIWEKTGVSGCKNTPYWDAFTSWEDWYGDPRNPVLRKLWHIECSREIAFLKSLRDTPTNDENDDAA